MPSSSTSTGFTPSSFLDSSFFPFLSFLFFLSSFSGASFFSFLAASFSRAASSSERRKLSMASRLRKAIMTSVCEPQEAWLRIPKLSVSHTMASPLGENLGDMSKYPLRDMSVTFPVAASMRAMSE